MSVKPSPLHKLEKPAGVLEQRNWHRPGGQEGLVNAARGYVSNFFVRLASS